MRATDIARHRRQRASRANRVGRRLARGLAATALVALLAAVLLPLVVVAGGAGGLLLLTRDLPDVHALDELPARLRPSTATTRLLAWTAAGAGGERRAVVIDEIADPRIGGGGWVAPDALPEHAVAAWLAANDPQFFTAGQPSLAALWRDWLRSGIVVDAHSPVTRRLIADHLRDGAPAAPGDTRRALQDWALARQLEQTMPRAQQLEWAMNSRYYGSLAYGIEAAARVYFDRGAADLSLGQSAMLAALSRNPGANPFDDPAAARGERDAVLATMTTTGAISSREAAAAREEPLATAAPPGSQSAAPRFARLARRELEAILGPERLLAGGWQVETTLDPAAQEQVECVIARATGAVGPGGAPPCAAAEGWPEAPAAATAMSAVVLNPTRGEIEALAGEAGAPHAIGTLVRPFIYLTALSQGHTAAEAMLDVPGLTFSPGGPPASPEDPDGLYLGPLRLRQALAADRAVPAAQALSWVGADLTRETARALGLQPDGPDVSSDLSFAADGFVADGFVADGFVADGFVADGFAASLLDIGRAFATIGNGGAMAGLRPSPATGELPRLTTVRRIADAAGGVVYAYEPATRGVLAPELAWLLTDMLADDDARCALVACPATPALPDGRAVAVSRGRSAAGDAWAVGYTPDRLVGVRADGGAAGGEDGQDIAAAAGRGLMRQLIDGARPATWPRPPSLRALEVCAMSGLLPSAAGCPTVRDWFIPGTEPTAVDATTVEVAVNRETGRLATVFTPPRLVERRVYTVVPPEATEWAAANGIEAPPAEYDTIGPVRTRSGAAELRLEPWAVVDGLLPLIGSAGGDDFAAYRLAVFPGLMPERMENLVARGETPVEAAELAVWDTTRVADGLYTLLLTVLREDGTFDEVAVPVIVGNNR